ncbi:MAG: UDP-N-acetylmuramate--L-alanine ligase, partial [Sphingomonas bacterium]|nr:UDP-N-acetylmuramate--L-alanine ligase [Sphingomonas bacterium]
PEHLDHYGSFDNAKNAFVEFVENVPFYGLAVMNIDHAEVQSVLGRIRDRRVVTYGFSALADLRGENLRSQNGGTMFDAVVRGRDDSKRTIGEIFLPMPGKHNVSNALAAIAVGLELGMDDKTIAKGFVKFGGVKRRFSKVGEVDGATIIDDYAHHPVEIRAVLSAAREAALMKDGTGDGAFGGRVIAVVQPHRYSRLRDLMEDFQNAFNDADIVYVAPVYAAGEQPIEGVDAHALADGLRHHGHRMVKPVDNAADLAGNLRDVAAEGDIVVCMGAGDITKWAAGLADGIRKARAKKK